MSTNFSNTDWVTYDVSGDALEAVANSIADFPEAGRCEWFPRWSSSWDGDGVITEVSVDIDTRITLPNWAEESSASDVERAEWRRFLDALQQHEQGHCAFVVQHLADIDQRMVGESHADAERTFNEALAALQAASDDYDSQTDHGRNAGTTIDY